MKNDLTITQLAGHLAASGYFLDAAEASQAVVKVLAGQELGIPPIASMTGIDIVSGNVSVGANTMAGLVRKSGRYDYTVDTWTDQECAITFTRDGKVLGTSTFTHDDAKRAGLLSKGPNSPHHTHPKAMKFARAMSQGVKVFCPDILLGRVYVDDESAEISGEPQPDRDAIVMGMAEQVLDLAPLAPLEHSLDDSAAKPGAIVLDRHAPAVQLDYSEASHSPDERIEVSATDAASAAWVETCGNVGIQQAMAKRLDRKYEDDAELTKSDANAVSRAFAKVAGDDGMIQIWGAVGCDPRKALPNGDQMRRAVYEAAKL